MKTQPLPECFLPVRLLVAGALAAACLGVTHAQPVMKEGAVSEAALVEALAPDEPEMKTRSIRVRPTAGMAGDAVRKPKASLLVTFNTNSTELTAAAKDALAVVARALKSERLAAHKFAIEGHADPRGSRELNQKLSEGRAASVRAYLVEQTAIAPDRLVSVGKGDREPINAKVPAAPENRRVTFVTQTN